MLFTWCDGRRVVLDGGFNGKYWIDGRGIGIVEIRYKDIRFRAPALHVVIASHRDGSILDTVVIDTLIRALAENGDSTYRYEPGCIRPLDTDRTLVVWGRSGRDLAGTRRDTLITIWNQEGILTALRYNIGSWVNRIDAPGQDEWTDCYTSDRGARIMHHVNWTDSSYIRKAAHRLDDGTDDEYFYVQPHTGKQVPLPKPPDSVMRRVVRVDRSKLMRDTALISGCRRYHVASVWRNNDATVDYIIADYGRCMVYDPDSFRFRFLKIDTNGAVLRDTV
jgi:hypothetical protein